MRQGFEYLKNELTLPQYEKATAKAQDAVLKTLQRPINLDDEVEVETAFFDILAQQKGNQSVIYGNDVEGTLLELDPHVKDNPWAPMRISLHPDSPIRCARPRPPPAPPQGLRVGVRPSVRPLGGV